MPAEKRTYYVFADTNDPMCWHNLHFTRCITSAGVSAASSDPVFAAAYSNGTAIYVPYVPNSNRSSGFISRFSITAAATYTVEYDAEYTRYKDFSLLPSRFSCVFAFASEEDCKKANKLYGWDLAQVRKFRLVDIPGTRVHRANMEIISLMRGVLSHASWNEQERQNIWRHYWSGGGSMKVEIPVVRNGSPQRQLFESGEVWEHLIEGRLELIDQDA
jgi:hypothetical protein